MKIIAHTNIPENMAIDGNITINSASFHVIQTSQGIAEGFRLELNLSIDAEVDGFKLDKFCPKITHTLSNEEFVNFMEHLSEPKPLP